MTIKLIVAVGENNEIGKDNQLLWHIPSDLKFFKNTTTGKTVVMGRKTYESIGKPLPNRKNIIISRKVNPEIRGCYQTNDINDILSLQEDVFVIGGEQVYKLFLPYADEILVTHVMASYPEADTFFPAINPEEWQIDDLDITDTLLTNSFRVCLKRRES